MSYKWWNSTDTLLLASLFNMVSREFFWRAALSSWAHELEEGKCGRSRRESEREMLKQSCLEPVGSSRKEKRGCGGSPAASGGLPPWEQTPSTKGKQRGREVWGWGDRDNHMSGVNCYKYQESNQYVKMCVPLFTCTWHINEKRGEREEELERKRRDY